MGDGGAGGGSCFSLRWLPYFLPGLNPPSLRKTAWTQLHIQDVFHQPRLKIKSSEWKGSFFSSSSSSSLPTCCCSSSLLGLLCAESCLLLCSTLSSWLFISALWLSLSFPMSRPQPRSLASGWLFIKRWALLPPAGASDSVQRQGSLENRRQKKGNELIFSLSSSSRKQLETRLLFYSTLLKTKEEDSRFQGKHVGTMRSYTRDRVSEAPLCTATLPHKLYIKMLKQPTLRYRALLQQSRGRAAAFRPTHSSSPHPAAAPPGFRTAGWGGLFLTANYNRGAAGRRTAAQNICPFFFFCGRSFLDVPHLLSPLKPNWNWTSVRWAFTFTSEVISKLSTILKRCLA